MSEREMRALGRALKDETEYSVVNHGNVDCFRDLLEQELLDFFNDLDEIEEKKTNWLKLRKKLNNQISRGDYDEAYCTLENLYREVY